MEDLLATGLSLLTTTSSIDQVLGLSISCQSRPHQRRAPATQLLERDSFDVPDMSRNHFT